MKKEFVFVPLVVLIIAFVIAWQLPKLTSGEVSLELAITICGLVATGYFIWVQSWATKKMAELQLMPAVDVNMQYNRNVGKTFLWFYNSSNIPVMVLIKFLFKDTVIQEISLRLPPKKDPYWIRATAPHYEFPKSSLTLDVTLSLAIKKNNLKFNFTKSYVFDENNLCWNESTWDFPDDPYPPDH